MLWDCRVVHKTIGEVQGDYYPMCLASSPLVLSTNSNEGLSTADRTSIDPVILEGQALRVN